MQAVNKFYKGEGAEKGSHLAIEFEIPSEAISLDIPMLEGIEKDGWRIYPLVTPVVSIVPSFSLLCCNDIMI